MSVAWEDYLTKAKANIRAAEICHKEGLYDPSASRAYYAVFLAMVASLIRLTDYRPRGSMWDHADTQAQFNSRLITRQKVFAGDLGRIPMDLHERRLTADYRQRATSETVSLRSLEKARKFMGEVITRLEERDET